MADDEKGGGGGGTIKLPVIGPAKKKIVFVVAGVAGAWVLWRYYQSSQAGATDPGATDSNGDGYADAGTLPSVSGAVSPTNSYGQDDGSTSNTTDSYGFHGTTNSQWTQYVTTQLSASDQWSYTTIVTALGQYLANRPLDATQQQIVQAAIGLAGNPPEGTHVLIPGGAVPITVAPTGLKASGVFEQSFTLTWNAVSGAHSYRVYEGSTKVHESANTQWYDNTGRKPATKYGPFVVAAVSGGGTEGPKSSPVFVTTSGTPPIRGTKPITAPTQLHATEATSNQIDMVWGAVTGAARYELARNGRTVAKVQSTYYTNNKLKKNTAYAFRVRAIDSEGKTGPWSATVNVRTKK